MSREKFSTATWAGFDRSRHTSGASARAPKESIHFAFVTDAEIRRYAQRPKTTCRGVFHTSRREGYQLICFKQDIFELGGQKAIRVLGPNTVECTAMRLAGIADPLVNCHGFIDTFIVWSVAPLNTRGPPNAAYVPGGVCVRHVIDPSCGDEVVSVSSSRSCLFAPPNWLRGIIRQSTMTPVLYETEKVDARVRESM